MRCRNRNIYAHFPEKMQYKKKFEHSFTFGHRLSPVIFREFQAWNNWASRTRQIPLFECNFPCLSVLVVTIIIWKSRAGEETRLISEGGRLQNEVIRETSSWRFELVGREGGGEDSFEFRVVVYAVGITRQKKFSGKPISQELFFFRRGGVIWCERGSWLWRREVGFGFPPHTIHNNVHLGQKTPHENFQG